MKSLFIRLWNLALVLASLALSQNFVHMSCINHINLQIVSIIAKTTILSEQREDIRLIFIYYATRKKNVSRVKLAQKEQQ
jgi:hypothetical protein